MQRQQEILSVPQHRLDQLEFDRLSNQKGRLQPAFLIFGLRVGVIDNSRPNPHLRDSIAQHQGPDRDAEDSFPARGNEADRPGINAAVPRPLFAALQFLNDLHGAYLRTSDDRPAGKESSEYPVEIDPGL